MLGAIAGDIIGSVYESNPIKTTEFPLFHPSCRFTDDTILTVSLAESILTGQSYEKSMKEYYRQYPFAGYGGMFHQWATAEISRPYNSWGNGAAMRISPVGIAYDNIETVMSKAKKFTEITHNHPEGIKGAQATAVSIFLARKGKSKADIKEYIQKQFGYNLHFTCDEIRPKYSFDVSCQGTVPQSIVAFMDSIDFESAIRLAVSLGDDADTLACITGGIAQAFYKKIPSFIEQKVYEILDDRLREVTEKFMTTYCG